MKPFDAFLALFLVSSFVFATSASEISPKTQQFIIEESDPCPCSCPCKPGQLGTCNCQTGECKCKDCPGLANDLKPYVCPCKCKCKDGSTKCDCGDGCLCGDDCPTKPPKNVLRNYSEAYQKALKEGKSLTVFIDMEPNDGIKRFGLGSSNRVGGQWEVQVCVKGPWQGIKGPAIVESLWRRDTLKEEPWLEWMRTSWFWGGKRQGKPAPVPVTKVMVRGGGC